MARGRVQTYVEVDLSEFDDDPILEAAADIRSRLGMNDDGAFHTQRLASAIVRHDVDDALYHLGELVAGDRVLSNAADIGRSLAA